jgi:hypothetical protein
MQPQVGWSPATYEVEELDDDGYIDGINVVDGGTGYTGEAVTYSNVMFGTNTSDPINNFDTQNWVEIPFRVRCGAGEIESEFGGGGGSADTGNITFSGNRISTSSTQVEIYVDNGEDGYYGEVYVDRNEASLWAENDSDGDNPTYAGIITDINGGLDNPKVDIVVNPQSSNPSNPQKWTFDATGGLTFPDGTTQTTAYTGQGGGSGSFGGTTYYVMANSDGNVLTSTDGLAWSVPVQITTNGIAQVATDGKKIVYIDETDIGYTLFATPGTASESTASIDGLTGVGFNQIIYAGGYFVLAGRGNNGSYDVPAYGYSTDGESWTFKTISDQDLLTNLTNNNTQGVWFTDVDYNGVGFNFSIDSDSEIGGGIYTTSITETFTGVNYFSMVKGFQAAWNGTAWYYFNDTAGSGVNTSLDPRTGIWNGPLDTWGSMAESVGYMYGGESSDTFAGGGGVLALSDSTGHITYSTDNGINWTVVTVQPYTTSNFSINQDNPATITFTNFAQPGTVPPGIISESPAFSNEKIIITDAGEYNGTYYVEYIADNAFTLRTDQELTTSLDSSGFAAFSGGSVTFSHGMYIDALDYANGYFYAGNDNEQVFRASTSNMNVWTLLDDQDNAFEYWNDFYGYTAPGSLSELSNGDYTFTLNDDGSFSLPSLETTGYQPGYTLNGPTFQLTNDTSISEVVITGPAPDSENPNSRRLIIQGQRGFGGWGDNSAGEGGDIYLWAGVGGESNNSSASGGDIKVRGGAGQGSSTQGGYVKIEGGDVQFGNGQAGFVSIVGGNAKNNGNGGSGDGGDVYIQGGEGSVNHGQVHVNTGDGGTHHWYFDNGGDLHLPESGDIVDSNGDSVLNSLSPELTKDNGNLVSTTNLVFSGGATGLIADLDSGGDFDNWFNIVTGDPDGNTYAFGENDDGYRVAYKFNTDGSVAWKVGVDNLNGSDVTAYAAKWFNGSIYITVQYWDDDNDTDQIGVIKLNDQDGTITDSWATDSPADANPYPRDMTILPNGDPVVVGQTYGAYTTVSGILAQAGSTENVLVVNSSDLPSVPQNGNAGQWQVDTDNTEGTSWYQPNEVNYFYNMPVVTVTGNGGPKHYAVTTDYAEGAFVINVGGQSYIEVTAEGWTNGGARDYLLGKYGFTFTITHAGGTVSFQQNAGWSDVNNDQTVWRSEGVVNTLTGTALSDGATNIVSVDFQAGLQVNVRYQPAGVDGQSVRYDYGYVQQGGDGYQNGDQLKVLGSLLGGVDTGAVYTINPAGIQGDNTLIFSNSAYPNIGKFVSTTGWTVTYRGTTANVTSVTYDGANDWWYLGTDGTFTSGAGDIVLTAVVGNDCVFEYSQWGYLGNISGNPSEVIKNQTRFNMSQNVDFSLGPVTNRAYGSTASHYTQGTGIIVTPTVDGSTDGTITIGDESTWILLLGRTEMLGLPSGKVLQCNFPDNGGVIVQDLTLTSAFVNGVATYTSGATLPTTSYPNQVAFEAYDTPAVWDIRSSLQSQAFVWTPSWQKLFGGTNWETFKSVAYDSVTDSLYALGDFNTGDSSLLFKLDADNGDVTWSKFVEDDNMRGSNPGSVAVDSQGNVVVVGQNDDGYTTVTKLDTDGVSIWQSVQNDNENWNNEVQCGIDSDNNIIIGGSWYNNNDPDNSHYVLSFMKLHSADGNLIWARYLDNTQKFDMNDQYDEDTQLLRVVGNSFYFGSYVYDENDNRYVAVASRFSTDGTGTGTYGRWVYFENQDAQWTYNNTSYVNDYSVDSSTGLMSSVSANFNTTADSVGVVTVHTKLIGAGGAINNVTSISFADGTSIESAFPGLARHSTTQGDNNIILDATMNGKFLHYNGGDGNSWIYVPGNADVPLPIGFVVTIVMDDFSGSRIYVNNEAGNNYDAHINAVGFSPNTTNYWVIGTNGNTGVYTLMKVDTDRWILSGPDVQVD